MIAVLAYDSRRDGVPEAEGVPDGQDPLADLQSFRVAEMDKRKFFPRLDLDEGDVGLGVGAYHLRLKLLFLEQDHRDFVGFLYDVVVGEDIPVIGDDEPGAQTSPFLFPGEVPEEVVEEIFERVLSEGGTETRSA
jgi:hypothetical protein